MLVNSNEKSYSALHSRNNLGFKSSLLSKKAMLSDNQFFNIMIYLKLARILMLFSFLGYRKLFQNLSSSALKQSCLLTDHDLD